jgi:FtsH-binding integral membrane protein
MMAISWYTTLVRPSRSRFPSLGFMPDRRFMKRTFEALVLSLALIIVFSFRPSLSPTFFMISPSAGDCIFLDVSSQNPWPLWINISLLGCIGARVLETAHRLWLRFGLTVHWAQTESSLPVDGYHPWRI